MGAKQLPESTAPFRSIVENQRRREATRLPSRLTLVQAPEMSAGFPRFFAAVNKGLMDTLMLPADAQDLGTTRAGYPYPRGKHEESLKGAERNQNLDTQLTRERVTNKVKSTPPAVKTIIQDPDRNRGPGASSAPLPQTPNTVIAVPYRSPQSPTTTIIMNDYGGIPFTPPLRIQVTTP